MPWVWVSIGSNQDREVSIQGAVQALRNRFGPLRLSPVFESEAVGFTGQPFYNLVAGFATDREVGDLVRLFRELEKSFGREPDRPKFAPRTLDLDLLTYGDRVEHTGDPRLPRDEIVRYAFVLRPLAEIAGDERHPELGIPYRELWDRFDQASQPLQRVELELGMRETG